MQYMQYLAIDWLFMAIYDHILAISGYIHTLQICLNDANGSSLGTPSSLHTLLERLQHSLFDFQISYANVNWLCSLARFLLPSLMLLTLFAVYFISNTPMYFLRP